jgi:Fe-S cluster assembly ATP-binding protein
MNNTILEIKNLHANVGSTAILHGIDLIIKAGETHAIMGPNGSGKSTLANILAGKPNYTVTKGSVTFGGQDLLALTPPERALQGLFLAFQYPIEISGVNNLYFLRTALNTLRKQRQQPEVDAFDFMNLVKEKSQIVKMEESFLQREVNVGFSGGEKKRNEILQMLVLEPKLAVLDEIDSGLDVDALQLVAHGVNVLRDQERAFLVVTHYQRLLNYIVPDYVHVLINGKIVKSGNKDLALEMESKGYGWLEEGA